LQAGGPGPDAMDHLPGPHEGGTPIVPSESSAGDSGVAPVLEPDTPEEHPDIPGAIKAPDGQFYLPDPIGRQTSSGDGQCLN